jgi:hypothetical protein
MKNRQGKRANKRLAERREAHKGTRREGLTPPGSQNVHKGRWGSTKRRTK